jgi:hypothetical protein
MHYRPAVENQKIKCNEPMGYTVFANQLVLNTGEAFFYAEVGQPSQVELFLFHGVRKTK